MQIYQRFLTVFTGGLIIVAQSYAAGSEQASAALANLLAGSQYFQASFSQQVRDANGELVDESTGSMLLSRPGKLRWNIDSPIEQTIIVKGSEYLQYDRDIDQLIIQPLADQLSAMPQLLLSGDQSAIERQFAVTELRALAASSASESAIRVFTLKPIGHSQLVSQSTNESQTPSSAQNDNLFAMLTLEFTGEQLQAIAILDDLEQVSRFEFSDIDIRTPLAASVFDIDPPAGTDIIRR